MALTYDPYDNLAYDCTISNGHGVTVASFAAGETTEQGNTPNGQLASIGFNTKFIGYKAWSGNYLQRALHASSVMGAQILTSSAGGWTTCPDISGIDEAIVKEILDNGTSIIMPAGNGDIGTHNFCASVDPVNHCAFFPLSPYYDERIILVSGTGLDDKHAQINVNSVNITHSHYPDVDLCAPGHDLMGAQPTACGANTWPYYGSSGGTSFATPIVAGTAALMYAANPCLTPSLCQDILKNTTDPILDAASFPGMVGTGRLNAYKAVREAQATYSPNLDLYIKDRPEDLGRQDFPYHWQADRDESPDIWVRNQQDGQNNQTHQQPEYQSSSSVWVYVKVRNKSCVTSTGSEILNLYWSKASSWSSWPQNWDGNQPTIGDLIGTANIPVIEPGREAIIEFEWTILNPYIYNNWGSCLLARIENPNNPSIDPITIYPGRLDDDVFYNNNIALRNVTVIDIVPGLAPPGDILSVYYPHGSHVLIGNPSDKEKQFDFNFGVDKLRNGNGININDIEIKLIFDDSGWEIVKESIAKNPDIKILKEKEILLKNGVLNLEGIRFPANKRIPVYIGFKILNDNLSSISDLTFHLRQYLTNNGSPLGGVHFNLNYEKNGNVVDPIHKNNPSITENPNHIIRMNPNPANSEVLVEFKIEKNKTANLLFIDEIGSHQIIYPINQNDNKYKVDLNQYHSGKYTVVLIVDNEAKDSKSLLITK